MRVRSHQLWQWFFIASDRLARVGAGKIVTQMTAPGGGTYRLKGIVFPQGANGQFSVDSSQYNEGAVVVSAQLYVG